MSLTGYNPYTYTRGFRNQEFHHAVLSVSGTWHTLYLDGVQVAQNLSGGNIFASYQTITNTVIGAQTTLSQAFQGTIGDVRVYNYAIPQTLVTNLYRDRELIVYYPFDTSVNALTPNYATLIYDASLIGQPLITASAGANVGSGALALSNTAGAVATQYVKTTPGIVGQIGWTPDVTHGITFACWINVAGVAGRVQRIFDIPLSVNQKGLSVDISGTNMLYSGWNAPVVAGFTPNLVSGLTLWFDANVASTFDAPTQVWTDRSGNGYKLNLTSNTNTLKISFMTVPSTTKTALQIPYLTNKWIFQTSASANFLFQPSYTLFYVFYNATNPGGDLNILWSSNGNTTYAGQVTGTNNYAIVNPATTLSSLLVNNSLNILKMSISSTNSVTVTLNGSNASPGAYSPPSPTSYYIQGGGSQSSNNSTMYIGDIAYYNSVLTTDQSQQVEGYLAWKWGLQTSLPTTHPYYPAAPLATTTNFSLGNQYALTGFGAGAAATATTYTFTNSGAGVPGNYVFSTSLTYTGTIFTGTLTNLYIGPTFSNTANGNKVWTSDGVYSSGGNTSNKSTTYNGATTVLGEWMQVQLPRSIVLLQYNVGSTQDSATAAGGPSNWILLGSNNGSTWFSVDNQLSRNFSFNSWASNAQTALPNYMQLNPVTNNSTSYSYYRLVITKSGGRGNLFITHFNVIGNVTAPSLVLYWPFDTTLNENINNYTATLYGTTPAPAISNSIVAVGTGSLNATGTDAYVSYTNPNGILPISNTYTFSFWYYLPSALTKYSRLFSFADSGHNSALSNDIGLYFNQNVRTLYAFVNTGSAFNGSEGPIATLSNLNTWYHIVMSITSTTNVSVTLWVNNTKYTSTLRNPIPQVARRYANINGGSHDNAGGTNFTGYPTPAYVDDFRVYTQLLTDAEVTALYNNRNIYLSGRVAYFPFNDTVGSSTITEVITSTSLTGTANGGTLAVVSASSRVGTGALDCTSSRFFTTPTISITLSGNATFCFWINFSVLPSSPYKCCIALTGGATQLFLNNASGGGGAASTGLIFNFGGYISTPIFTPANTTTWNHLAITITNSTNWVQYVNGVQVSTGTNTLSLSTTYTSATFGNFPGLNQESNCFLDDVMIYNRALSASEISSIYNLT